MSRQARAARTVPRLGKLPPRYHFFLNPYLQLLREVEGEQ
jgi:hypothetical protein